jgi:phosphoglycolate phosphatase
MDIDAIIFDLDGTLVDSSAGILASFAGAFQSCGQKPVHALSSDIIGPPLMQTLHLLAGTEDVAVIEPLAAAFKAYYDEEGFRETKVYAGVPAMLQLLAQDSRPVFIATNKRKRPTDAIIDWLKWGSYFQAVYALDSFQPPAPSKGALIRHILDTHQLAPGRTLYIGDREDDARAASEANTCFYQAVWGYGQDCSASASAGVEALMAQLQHERTP